MYVWCSSCKEYRKYCSGQWRECNKDGHKMSGADERFKKEIEKTEQLVLDSKKNGQFDEKIAGRLGILKAIEQAKTNITEPADRVSEILQEKIQEYVKTDDGQVYFWIERENGSYDALSRDSEKLVNLVLLEYDRLYSKTISRMAVVQAIGMHNAKGDMHGNVIRDAGKRVIKKDDAVWVDLRNTDNSIYRVTPKQRGPAYPYGPDMKILFNRDGGAEMPYPKRTEKDWLSWFCTFLRIPDDMQMLFKVHLCHMFCMWHETPFMMFVGPYGSGKSLTAALVKELVDPAGLLNAYTTLPQDDKHLALLLTKEQVVLFDNVSFIRAEISDMLCQACTGGMHRIRELYTTNSMITIAFRKMRVLFTSISRSIVRAPDLASRMLCYDVQAGQKNKSKNKLEASYMSKRPYVLYHALNVIGQAQEEYASRKEHYDNLPTTTRMTDFEQFGSAIAHVLGDKDYSSIQQYREIMSSDMAMMVADDPVVVLIEKMLEVDQADEYFGLTRVLLARMVELAINDDTIDERGKDFPKNTAALRRHIDRLRGAFLERDIEISVGKISNSNAVEKGRSHVRIKYNPKK